MNLEEAILHLKELIDNHDFGCLGCKRDHEELLGFLEELKQRRGEDGRRCRSMKDAMLEALEEIENGMCRIKERRSIWQNSLVYALCQAVRLLLIDKIKEWRE